MYFLFNMGIFHCHVSSPEGRCVLCFFCARGATSKYLIHRCRKGADLNAVNPYNDASTFPDFEGLECPRHPNTSWGLVFSVCFGGPNTFSGSGPGCLGIYITCPIFFSQRGRDDFPGKLKENRSCSETYKRLTGGFSKPGFQILVWKKLLTLLPIPSMGLVYLPTYIWLICMVNIPYHGCYGL